MFKVKIKEIWKEFYTHNEDFICEDIEYSKDKTHFYPVNNSRISRKLITNNCIIEKIER